MLEVIAFAYAMAGVYVALEDMPPDRDSIERMLGERLSSGAMVFMFFCMLFIAALWVPILILETLAHEGRRNG